MVRQNIFIHKMNGNIEFVDQQDSPNAKKTATAATLVPEFFNQGLIGHIKLLLIAIWHPL